MQLVFCTNNQHKIDEVQQIFNQKIHFLTLHEVGFAQDIPEPFLTLEENSLIKSQTVYDFCGKNCFSEDTGLFVNALQGQPGVLSARYAGPQASSTDNIQKLLHELQTHKDRSAYFKTVVTLIIKNTIHQFSGTCQGIITTDIQGTQGFGYDPIFVPDGSTLSFAQMNLTEKNMFSHRRKAFDSFTQFLLHYTP